MEKSNIGLIGLAVMGENLAMNIANHGYGVSVYNISHKEISAFVNGRGKGLNVKAAYGLEELVSQLEKPRKIMMMIKAGSPVDEVIDNLLPLLDKGDIIIDGGNSNFHDTQRRYEYVESKGLLYVGMGVSGGEEGALKGPSLMPGGSKEAWPHVKDIFQSIAAKVEDGSPCCQWVGSGSAGHFVKMVHNGIEYGDMQLICEAYQLMRDALAMAADEIHDVFAKWNLGDLDSYLIEITADILAYKDEDGSPLVDNILDAAGQKGTGKWTVISALDEGVALTLIGEAVFSRCLSAVKEERVAASKVLKGPKAKIDGGDAFINDIHDALFASKVVSYAQGYSLMAAAAESYGWNLNYGEIAMMWRGGCIIRSVFLGDIKKAYDKEPGLKNLMLDDYFKSKIDAAQNGWRRVCSAAVNGGIPVPAMYGALGYYDGYRCEKLPANLLQAQRDYFGAHTYERLDAPRGKFFHTNWTGKGGSTSSSAYNV